MEYLDFEVEVAAGATGGYEVAVVRSPAGEASGAFDLPFDTLALQNRLQALEIALLRSGGRRRAVASPEEVTVRTFGQELFDALFSDDVLARLEVSRNEARQREAGLRLKLRITAPDLAALPWEYLYDARDGDFLSLSLSTPVVRYIPLAQDVEPLDVTPPLRILAMAVSPEGTEPLDLDAERGRLERAVASLRTQGLVELRWVAGDTWRSLQAELRRGPWHIFHFIGHGGFDRTRGEGIVVLADEAGKAHELSATDIGRLLGDHEPMRLAVLNSCDGARGDTTDVFSSTAATLVRRGTPAVVAMQYEITDAAAIEFCRSFYEAVADGLPVDSALGEARKGISLSIPNTLEWGTPVLYMRANDGRLFRVSPAPVAPSPAGDDGAVAPAVAAAAAAEVVAPAGGAPETAAAAEVVAPTVEAEGPTIDIAPPPPTITETVFAAAAVPPPVGPPTTFIPVGTPAVQHAAAATTPRISCGVLAALIIGIGAAAFVALAAIGALIGPSIVPTIVTSTPQAAVGERITLSGSGFMNGEFIEVRIGDVLVGTTVTDGDGGFFVTFDVPAGVASGAVSATGSASNRVATQGFDVLGGDPPVPSDSPPPSDVAPSADASPAIDGGSPVASPLVSGERPVVFYSDEDGDFEIYTVDPVTSTIFKLTENDVDDRFPAWSPDGTRVVFSRDVGDDDFLFVIDVTTGVEAQLTGDPGLDWFPAWSPDAAWVAYTRHPDGEPAAEEDIFVVSALGGVPIQLTFEPGRDRTPSWSPDGSLIVFSSDRDGNVELYWMQADGSGQQRLTDDPGVDRNPSWSPDGGMIAYAHSNAGATGKRNLYVIDLATAQTTQLTNDDILQGNPVWSPDGTRIAFFEGRPDRFEIRVMQRDGSDSRTLTGTPTANNVDPNWR